MWRKWVASGQKHIANALCRSREDDVHTDMFELVEIRPVHYGKRQPETSFVSGPNIYESKTKDAFLSLSLLRKRLRSCNLIMFTYYRPISCKHEDTVQIVNKSLNNYISVQLFI